MIVGCKKCISAYSCDACSGAQIVNQISNSSSSFSVGTGASAGITGPSVSGGINYSTDKSKSQSGTVCVNDAVFLAAKLIFSALVCLFIFV